MLSLYRLLVQLLLTVTFEEKLLQAQKPFFPPQTP